jgi:predicted O-linked N-acetylglucosamine transferase (SPINDLY family)
MTTVSAALRIAMEHHQAGRLDLAEQVYRRRTQQPGHRFQAEGVAGDRLEFQGHSPLGEYLAAYNQIDVALDPFPHNGGLTTCDCLWMGVPVVTSPGETFAGRQSLSHLSTVGLTETIAGNLEEYVDVALRLAHDLPRLAALRAGLRQQVAQSPLCDGKQFAKNLMKILRQAWRERKG